MAAERITWRVISPIELDSSSAAPATAVACELVSSAVEAMEPAVDSISVDAEDTVWTTALMLVSKLSAIVTCAVTTFHDSMAPM